MRTFSRCCLVVPGSSDRFLSKARDLDVDEIVIDLEDAVAAGEKVAARARAVEAVAAGSWRARKLSVRVNAPGTEWCHEDLIACAGALVDSVVVPKADVAGIHFADRLLAGAEAAVERAEPLRLQALIETPAGVLEAAAVAQACGRLEALIIGYADLGTSLGRAPAASWTGVQDLVILAARAAGVAAIDGPSMAIEDTAQAPAAAAAGFDGKWAIHPSQVEPIVAAFSPSEDDVRRARTVIEALDAAAREGRGAVSVEGEMVDDAHRDAALRVLARAGSAAP